jgi:protein involved in polysaccharide export with SLBB domain
MTWKKWIAPLGIIVVALTFVGCQTAGPKEQYVCVDDEIRIGDRLKISLLDIPQPEADKEFDVRSDGTVNLQLLGSMKAVGKKFGEFEREVQKAYVDKKYFARITVVVKPDVRFYTVAGAVNSPTRTVYVGQTTVLRAIATCGDFTEFANRKKVEITRANGQKEIINCDKARRDPRFDRPICPGDYIFVPKSVL